MWSSLTGTADSQRDATRSRAAAYRRVRVNVLSLRPAGVTVATLGAEGSQDLYRAPVTLILTLVTDRFIVQASDRRVTYGDGRVGEVMNKAVVISTTACAAYTGLAFLDGKMPTDLFLMSAIDDAFASGTPVFDRLAHDAERAVRLNRSLPKTEPERSQIARTSFVVAAFVPVLDVDGHESGRRAPVLTIVSNAQFDLGESWADQAIKRFERTQVAVRGGSAFLHAAGVPVPSKTRKRLERALRHALERGAQPESVARLLARAVRDVHETNPGVGPSVNCVIVRDMAPPANNGAQLQIPVMTVPLGAYALREANFFNGPAGHIKAEPVSSIFLPHPDHPEVALGPSFVMPGSIQMHSPLMVPEPLAEIASRAVEDLRADRIVNLEIPRRFRRTQEPRYLP
jgi:hypothetical protein